MTDEIPKPKGQIQPLKLEEGLYLATIDVTFKADNDTQAQVIAESLVEHLNNLD